MCNVSLAACRLYLSFDAYSDWSIGWVCGGPICRWTTKREDDEDEPDAEELEAMLEGAESDDDDQVQKNKKPLCS